MLSLAILETESWLLKFLHGSAVCWGESWNAAKATNERLVTSRYNIVSRQNSHANRAAVRTAHAISASKHSVSTSTIADKEHILREHHSVAATNGRPPTEMSNNATPHTVGSSRREVLSSTMRSNHSDDFEL